LTRTARFTVAAEADFANAVEWYRQRGDALADRFVAEIAASVTRLEDNPFQFPIAHRDVWRMLLRRFPHAPFFRFNEDKIQILACFHTSRDPRAWRRRT
jgi:plasmid stabilization system protein ParE